MADYYCLLSGLPYLRLEDVGTENSVSVHEIHELIKDEDVPAKDKKLLSLFFMKGDCKNILLLLENSSADLPYAGNFNREELHEMQEDALEDVFTDDPRFPSFMAPFIREYAENRKNPNYFPEDRLMLRYWEYLEKEGTGFIRRWAELNMNISNILTALICRQQGWDVEKFIYGDNDVTYMIKTRNSAPDFDLSKEVDYAPMLMQIVQCTDPVEKEKKIDALKWNWLEDETFLEAFDINALYAYLLKAEMLDRWEMLDPEHGKETFQNIIEDLRSDCKVPEEFTTYMPEDTKTPKPEKIESSYNKSEGSYQK